MAMTHLPVACLRHGANAHLPSQTKDKTTPLHIAARQEQLDMVKLLVETYQVHRYTLDALNKTPYDVAVGSTKIYLYNKLTPAERLRIKQEMIAVILILSSYGIYRISQWLHQK